MPRIPFLRDETNVHHRLKDDNGSRLREFVVVEKLVVSALNSAAVGAACVVPPGSDTGGTKVRNEGESKTPDFRIGIHWVGVTVHDGRYLAEKLVREWLGGSVKWVGCTAFDGYQFAEMTEEGVKVLWSDNRPEARVVASGAACEALELHQVDLLLPLMTWPLVGKDDSGRKIGTVITRLDLAFDGWQDESGYVIQPWDLYAKIAPRMGGSYGALRTSAHRNDESVRIRAGSDLVKRRKSSLDDEASVICKGDTLEIGSRQSDRFLRVYNRRGYCRMEMELKGARVEYIRRCMRNGALAERGFVGLSLGLLRDYVEFVEPSSEPTRASLSPWFAACVGQFERITVKIKRRVAEGMSAAARNLRRQGRALCELMTAIDKTGRDGASELVGILLESRSRVRPDRVDKLAVELMCSPHVLDGWADCFPEVPEYRGELPALEPVPI